MPAFQHILHTSTVAAQESNEVFCNALSEFRKAGNKLDEAEQNHMDDETASERCRYGILNPHCTTCRDSRRKHRENTKTFLDAAVGASDSCSICTDPYDHTNVIITSPCKHPFHKFCYLQWRKEHGTCPLCMKVCNNRYSEIRLSRLGYGLETLTVPTRT